MSSTPSGAPKGNGRLKKNAIFVVGCLVSLVAIWLVTKDIDWPSFFAALRAFKLIWLVPAFLGFYISMYLRGVRWALLFRPHSRLKGHQAFGPLMIGFAFNNLLPARVGEFVRCLAINKTRQTGVTKAFATVFAERIFDGLTLLLMLALSLAMVPLDKSASVEWHGHTLDATLIASAERKLILFCLVLTAGVVAMLIPAVQRLVLATIRRLSFLPPALREKIAALFQEFSLGFDSVRDPLTLAQIVCHSVVLWVLVGVSNMTLAWGFGIDMNLWQAVAIVTLIGIAILIPAAPGYWGLYEAGVVFSLKILGFSALGGGEALAFGLVMHMLQWAPIVIYGLAYASLIQMKPTAAADEAAQLESHPSQIAP